MRRSAPAARASVLRRTGGLRMAQGEEELEKPRGNPWLAFDTRGGIFVWSVILLVFPFAAYGPIGSLLEDETQVRAFLRAAASFTGAPQNHEFTLPKVLPLQSWTVLDVECVVCPEVWGCRPSGRHPMIRCNPLREPRAARVDMSPPTALRLLPRQLHLA